MMGERTVIQEALFYEFSLERHVPAGHLVRAIDRFVDLTGIHAHPPPARQDRLRPCRQASNLARCAGIYMTETADRCGLPHRCSRCSKRKRSAR